MTAGRELTPHSWQPIDLVSLGEMPAEQPTLGLGFTYPGRVHLRSGEPESGKSMVSYLDCIAEIRAGRNVCVVDFEMGARLARSLLLNLGLEDFSGLSLLEPTEPLTDQAIRADVDRLITEIAPSLVLIDSYTARSSSTAATRTRVSTSSASTGK